MDNFFYPLLKACNFLDFVVDFGSFVFASLLQDAAGQQVTVEGHTVRCRMNELRHMSNLHAV